MIRQYGAYGTDAEAAVEPPKAEVIPPKPTFAEGLSSAMGIAGQFIGMGKEVVEVGKDIKELGQKNQPATYNPPTQFAPSPVPTDTSSQPKVRKGGKGGKKWSQYYVIGGIVAAGAAILGTVYYLKKSGKLRKLRGN